MIPFGVLDGDKQTRKLTNVNKKSRKVGVRQVIR
jgi:hypothetical protein